MSALSALSAEESLPARLLNREILRLLGLEPKTYPL